MNRVHGLKTDSKAYALANFTYSVYKQQGEKNAETFLRHQAKIEKLKAWELIAIADCVAGLIKDGTDYHCIICQTPCNEPACDDCYNFVKSLNKKSA